MKQRDWNITNIAITILESITNFCSTNNYFAMAEYSIITSDFFL